MKTTLPERSLIIKERLDNIVQEILAAGKAKIAMIILFGSYARGDWVQDSEYKEGIIYTYQSDFDILLVLKKGKYAGHQATMLQHKIEKRLERKVPTDITKEAAVTLVLEPVKMVNEQLEKGQYFFCDIIKEGILLYDSGEFMLSEARNLPWSERREIAKEDYAYWIEKASWFLEDSVANFKKERYSLSAFLLHQATESFYNAILLVFSGYKPKEHDILELGKMARSYHHDLYKIFPYVTPEQVECFKLLRKAYIEGRYNKHYKISKDQLLYLIERVEKLKTVTEEICLERIRREEV